MSLRRKIPKNISSQVDYPGDSSLLIPIPGPSGRPFHHLSKKTGDSQQRPLVFFALGKTLTQPAYIPPLQLSSKDTETANSQAQDPVDDNSPPQEDSDANLYNLESFDFPEFNANTNREGIFENQKKKVKQWQRWVNEVILGLIEPYMELMRKTQSLRLPCLTPSPEEDCVCEGKKRSLQVTCVCFDRVYVINIETCSCKPAAIQLLCRGLFPCAPCAPTLAVDMNLLDFTCELFVNMPPNQTAFCAALEAFLRKRAYKLKTKDSLRRRFSSCLQWYTYLRDRTEILVKETIECQRFIDKPNLSTQCTSQLSCTNADVAHDHRQALSDSVAKTIQYGVISQPQIIRHTSYLRSHCPLCFGSGNVHDKTFLSDVIVCISACFTQKCRRSPHDPLHVHPETVFIPEDELKAVESRVESVRPSRQPTLPVPVAGCKRRREVDLNVNTHVEIEDGYEGVLEVPNSVLNGCKDSFKAADKQCLKASTQFFDDTGLMALLCRHDRVLWLANMKSAGEKQHYAIALLERLFQHIPLNARVGILYDIGYQLHRSCIKWNFLEAYLPRITFGVSVLHVYGHEWPCQLIYHPRKRKGFGLSDGEGCERFWSKIQKLIPGLRVTGFHKRLYTLDTQVHYIDRKSLNNLGVWFARHMDHCRECRHKAEAILQLCPIDQQTLRNQWQNQIEHQTKPLPKQSKIAGKKAVDELFSLQRRLDFLRAHVQYLERQVLRTSQIASIGNENINQDLEKARADVIAAVILIQRKEISLGASGKGIFEQLKFNPYFTARMNVQAMKQRLLQKLRSKKFELSRMEHINKNQANDRKLQQHINSQIKRRDPTINQLLRSHNKLCDQISNLILSKKATPGAVPPVPIDSKSLFSLDIDNDIWADTSNNDRDTAQAPEWLSNDNVKIGIQALLELDRCTEEEQRLHRERIAMQEWFSEEWQTVKAAEASIVCTNAGLAYQLAVQLQDLKHLCYNWTHSIRLYDVDNNNLPHWGPTDDELLDINVTEHEGMWDDGLNTSHYDIPSIATQKAVEQIDSSTDDEFDESDRDSFMEDEADLQLLETMEVLEFEVNGDI